MSIPRVGYLRTFGKWLIMFGFGTSAVATFAMIIGAPMLMCALLYVLVRLEPPVRRPMWLVGSARPAADPDSHEGSETAA